MKSSVQKTYNYHFFAVEQIQNKFLLKTWHYCNTLWHILCDIFFQIALFDILTKSDIAFPDDEISILGMHVSQHGFLCTVFRDLKRNQWKSQKSKNLVITKMYLKRSKTRLPFNIIFNLIIKILKKDHTLIKF